MILAVDVDYRIDNAIVAGITFSGWSDEAPDRVIYSRIINVVGYQSGQFYRREMPCILKLLNDYLDSTCKCISQWS